MSDFAIQVEHLGKCYQLGERESYKTVREAIRRLASAPLRAGAAKKKHAGEFWALKDVSFQVEHGEVFGIVGSNGAGKSTLLKVLSRITEPTEGRAVIRGRLGSLLEVGTGFHPELTGRENVYLNGAIIGMKKKEIQRKFDEIVQFAEVEKFLDTPVKRYSSGMYVRLAFAVAAHLEPEILLVDEVLAVGDAAFQQKCLGKMSEVAGEGRTVFFVSHNMTAVRQLCHRALLLEGGKPRAIGPADEIVTSYLEETVSGMTGGSEIAFPDREGVSASFTHFRVCDEAGATKNRVAHSQSFATEIDYVVHEPLEGAHLYWMLETADNVQVMGSNEEDWIREDALRTPGRYRASVRFPGGVLNAGYYRYRVSLQRPDLIHDYQHGAYFEVFDDTDYGSILAGAVEGPRNGVILLQLPWSDEKLEG